MRRRCFAKQNGHGAWCEDENRTGEITRQFSPL